MDNPELPGKIPPHNEAAEKAVLGALLLAPDRIPELAEALVPDDFFVARHRQVFATLLDLGMRNAKVDLITVGEALPTLYSRSLIVAARLPIVRLPPPSDPGRSSSLRK